MFYQAPRHHKGMPLRDYCFSLVVRGILPFDIGRGLGKSQIRLIPIQ